MLIICSKEIIDKTEFNNHNLNENVKVFAVYMASHTFITIFFIITSLDSFLLY